MASQKHGLPAEELFLNKPSGTDPQTPTVGPLRINKATNSSPPPRLPSAGSQTQGASPYPAPTSKPPTAPLPYPDDRARQGSASSRTNPPYPTFDGPPKSTTPSSETSSGRRRGSSVTVPQATSSPRAKFSANDPNRPTVSGYAHPPIYANAGQTASPVSAASATGSSLSEKRSNVPKPITTPVSPDQQDGDGLFQREPQRAAGQTLPAGNAPKKGADINPFPEYHQQYWPPPSSGAPGPPKPSGLQIPATAGNGLSRFDSTASVATTRAQRGSPPPPETPIVEPPGGGIEARYAAAGIGAPPSTVPALGSAAAQRAAQYPSAKPSSLGATPPPGQQPIAPGRPWTPTEQPGANPHGPPTVYQGMNEVPTSSAPQPVTQSPAPAAAGAVRPGQNPLEQDLGRLNVHDEPPPAYSTVHPNGSASSQGYPNEKARPVGAGGVTPVAHPVPGSASVAAAAIASNQGHPAFANDPRLQPGMTPSPAQGGAVQPHGGSPAPAAGPASPPPLPEGWIAHLDPNSGQYYYIHLPSQSTQWEFPKGPTPLNLNEPLSPTGTFVNPLSSPVGSTFGSKLPLASPGFGGPQSQSATFRPDTYMSMSAIGSPTAAGFTGPPPSAGVDVYKVAPTNGVYFGPYLRYCNMDIERGMWIGSVMLVTDAPQPPTIHIHQSVDLSPNPRQLKAQPIFSHQRWMFYRYEVDLQMEDQGMKWTYAITSHLGCTRYEFLVAGRHETSWRFIAHSGNDFALNVNANERSRLGGVGYMWKDILQKHIECNGFHAQLGLGDQVYADRMWKEIPLLKQWTATSGKDNRKNATWTPRHDEEVTHAYFHYYTSHFDQPHLREAFAQIPHVLTLDDHDM
jgi:hypothetical protein